MLCYYCCCSNEFHTYQHQVHLYLCWIVCLYHCSSTEDMWCCAALYLARILFTYTCNKNMGNIVWTDSRRPYYSLTAVLLCMICPSVVLSSIMLPFAAFCFQFNRLVQMHRGLGYGFQPLGTQQLSLISIPTTAFIYKYVCFCFLTRCHKPGICLMLINSSLLWYDHVTYSVPGTGNYCCRLPCRYVFVCTCHRCFSQRCKIWMYNSGHVYWVNI